MDKARVLISNRQVLDYSPVGLNGLEKNARDFSIHN